MEKEKAATPTPERNRLENQGHNTTQPAPFQHTESDRPRLVCAPEDLPLPAHLDHLTLLETILRRSEGILEGMSYDVSNDEHIQNAADQARANMSLMMRIVSDMSRLKLERGAAG
ncbi:MAG: hypothetical protein KJ900_13165 [Proteobacteria bacterium]|nr:hypothetical protein [Desulfocapsa sp.]MBU3943467.1 hypothetical protein [Pseudomonadota bacterium]MCG2745496.1 hypothetical protein [Desulfobacteraceae bacterium]MBU4028956.1 hypothetical protein [Pseudomonadota bacterium]MBU4043828.1 hypothetical protein [Pseudomonadota bacterium]